MIILKKRILSIFLILVACIGLANIVSYAGEVKSAQIYVAPDAKKGAAGTIEDPCQLNDVPSKINIIKKESYEPIEIQVILRGGVYRRTGTYTISANHGGDDNEHRVIYKAMEGETPILKGSKEIDLTKLQKVTDYNILKKIDKEARDKLGYIDLKAQGITKVAANPEALNYSKLYLNDSQQMLAQWPNGEYNYKYFTSVSPGSSSVSGEGGTFNYGSETRPSRWTEAKDGVIEFYPGWNYDRSNCYIKSIDTKQGNITLKHGVNFGVTNVYSPRWRAINLLEEIDRPTEYYIDRNTMTLYYYPPYGLKNSKLEISTLGSSMINLSPGAENITFEGITFAQTCGDVIHTTETAEYKNITIDRCNFYDIGGYCFYYRSYRYSGFWDHADWQNPIGNFRNLVITNNMVFNVNQTAFFANGMGNVETIEKYGLIVKNNYINQISSTTAAMQLHSVEGDISNNLIHNVPFYALGFGGINNKYKNNEVVRTVGQVVDSGAFYAGRTVIQRGNEFAYNYFYKTGPVDQKMWPLKHNRGIYFDDCYAGGYIHHNIFAGGDGGGAGGDDKGASTSGSGSKYYSNIFVDLKKGLNWGFWQGRDFYTPLMSHLPNSNLEKYLKAFPQVEEEYEALKKIKFNSSVFNEAVGNYFLNTENTATGLSDLMKKSNKIENEIIGTGYTDFVDYENKDYRIRKDSEAYKRNPDLISEDFDLSSIGIQWDEGFDKSRITSKRNFRKLYPQNGRTNVGTNDVEFLWEKSFDVDSYRFVLAKDPEFKEIVVDKNVPYNYCTVEQLDADYTKYYWTVYGVNETMSMSGEWEANGVPYVFATTKYEFLNFEALEATVIKVEQRIPYITEGTTPGTFKPGTINRINSLLQQAKEAVKWEVGVKRQSDVEALVAEIEESISEDYINDGFFELGPVLKNKSRWTIRNEKSSDVRFEDGVVSILPKGLEGSNAKNNDAFLECLDFDIISKRILFSFSMKVDFVGSGWIGFGVRAKEPLLDLWSCENYFFVIKSDKIEVQLRGSGKSGILEEIPNTYIKDNEWCDIVFGAYDCGFGQLMTLIVNGEVVRAWMDTDTYQITRTGGLKIYSSQCGLYLRNTQNGNSMDFKKLVADNKIIASGELCKVVEGYLGKSQVFVDGCNYYYAGNMNKGNIPMKISSEGAYMMTAEGLNAIGVAFSKNDNGVTLTSNGNSTTIESNAVLVENDTIYVPVEEALYSLGLNVYYFDDVLIVGKNTNYAVENDVGIRAKISKAFNNINDI